MPREFRGEIKLDIRESTPDWDAFLPDRAPEGAPNVLVVLYDDTGLCGVVALRRADRHAHDGPPGRQRADLRPSGTRPPCARRPARCSSPAATTTRTGSPRSPRPRPASRATTRTSRPSARRWRPCCATPGGARSGSARTTTCPSTRGRWGRRRRTGRSAWATTASTASSAARPTSGIPTWPRTTTTSTSPPCPRTATTCRRTWPTRRWSSSATPSSPSPTSPGTCGSARARTTRPTTRRRSTSTSTRGRFDDGYEAYREWVLPRMIERGILPEGTELTPINPMAAGTFSEGDSMRPWDTLVRRGEAAVQPDGRGLRRLLGVHRRPGRPHRRLPGGVGPARQHDHPLLRRQRRVGRGQPQRLGQREQVLQRLSRHHRGQPAVARPAGHARHLQPLPDRLGGGVLDPVPDVQALLVPGRRGGPAGDPLARRVLGPGRGAPAVPPLHRHRADHPRLLRRRDARRRPRRGADPAAGRVDALLVRRRRRADAEGDAVLRDARHPGHLAPGVEGGDRARPGPAEPRPVRPGPVAAVPHRRGPRRGPRPRRPASRQARGAEGPVAAPRPRSTTSCR